MSTATLLDRLRRHVIFCRRCDVARGIYCQYVALDVERFYELRRDEVLAARGARWAGSGG